MSNKKENQVKNNASSLVLQSAESFLKPIDDTLTSIKNDTLAIVGKNLHYIVDTGERLAKVKAHLKEMKDKYKKSGYIVEVGEETGVYANLASFTDSNGVLGSWSYLKEIGLIPFGTSQVFKMIRIAKQAEKLRALNNAQILELSLNDANEADKFASFLKKNEELTAQEAADVKLQQLEEANKPKKVETSSGDDDDDGETSGKETSTNADDVKKAVEYTASEPEKDDERRSELQILNGKKAIKVMYFESAYKSPKNVERALLKVLLDRHGLTILSPTERAKIIDQAQRTAKAQEQAAKA